MTIRNLKLDLYVLCLQIFLSKNPVNFCDLAETDTLYSVSGLLKVRYSVTCIQRPLKGNK